MSLAKREGVATILGVNVRIVIAVVGVLFVFLVGGGIFALRLAYIYSTYVNNAGLKAYAAGDLDTAEDDFNTALRFNPFLAVAYNNRGLVEHRRKEYALAIADFNTSLSLDPQQARGYNNRGLAREATGDMTGARTDFDKALELSPNSVTALGNRAELRDRLGDFDGAITDFNQALSLDGTKPDLFNNRGQAEYHKKEMVTAITDFTKAISLNDQNAKYYSNRSLAEKDQGKLDEALADLNKALQISPDDHISLNNRGLVEAKKHDLNAALADYAAALRADPKDATAYDNRAFVETEKYDWDDALADAKASYALRPTPVTRVLCGWIKFLKGDTTDAIADFNDGIQQEPNSPGFYEDRALAYFASGQNAAAVADFQKAIDLKTRSTNTAHFYLFLIRMESPGQKATAVADLNAYLTAEGPRLHGWAAQNGKFLTGQLTEADYIASSQDPDAVKTSRQLCEAYFFSAALRDLSGDKAGAADLYQKCVGTGMQDLSEYQIARARLAKRK